MAQPPVLLPTTIQQVAASVLAIWEHDRQHATPGPPTESPARFAQLTVNEQGPIPTMNAAKIVATVCTHVNAELVAKAGDNGIAPEYLLHPQLEAPDGADLGTIVVQGPIGATLQLRVLPPATDAQYAAGFAPVLVESTSHGHGHKERRESTTDPLHIQAELRLHAESVRKRVVA